MTIRAYVVDDEALAVKRLTRLLEATGRVEVVGSATEPEAALAFLQRNGVDVLFLDVQMPGLSGFELLERLSSDPLVVFTTAYDRYAIDAFSVNSVDYLLKPIEPERLDRAIDKLEKWSGTGLRTSHGDLSPVRPDVRALARELASHLRQVVGDRSPHEGDRSLQDSRRPVPVQRIASRVGERTTVLDVARVTHFFSKDKLTFAVTNGRDHVVDLTLAELEEKLDPRRFVRIHRATIVNTSFVQEMFPGVDGGVLVRLKDERRTELSVARDRVRHLKERLGI
jgi:two-component system, LytTR family, response regulator